MNAQPFGYGSLVSTSLRMAWALKPLWVLGIFVSATGSGIHEDLDEGGPLKLLFEQLTSDAKLAIVLLLLAFGLVLFIAALILRTISEGGLIHAGSAFAGGRSPTLGESWRAGTRVFVPVFLVFVAGLLTFIAACVLSIGIPILIGAAIHPIIGVFIGLFTVALLVAFLLFFVPAYSYALRSVVIDGARFSDGWSTAFAMVRAAPGRAVVISLVRVLYLFVVVVCGIIVGVIVLAPLVVLWEIWPPIAIAGGVLVALPIIVVVGGYLGSAGSYFWTLAFLWMRSLREEAATPASTPAPARPETDAFGDW